MYIYIYMIIYVDIITLYIYIIISSYSSLCYGKWFIYNHSHHFPSSKPPFIGDSPIKTSISGRFSQEKNMNFKALLAILCYFPWPCSTPKEPSLPRKRAGRSPSVLPVLGRCRWAKSPSVPPTAFPKPSPMVPRDANPAPCVTMCCGKITIFDGNTSVNHGRSW